MIAAPPSLDWKLVLKNYLLSGCACINNLKDFSDHESEQIHANLGSDCYPFAPALAICH